MPEEIPRGPPKEWEEFVGRKAESGMVAAVGLKHVPEGPQGEQLWSGVFRFRNLRVRIVV